MPSTDEPAARLPDDVGLLTPVTAGAPVAVATGDAAVLAAMLQAEAALVRARADLGLAPGTAADAVTAAARELDVRTIAARAGSGGNPVLPLVADLTAAVAARDPDAAARVHEGATSQDILDTALMLVAAHALDLTLADLDRTAGALARLAAAHRDTVMAGRTLTQHAVPTTFGLKAAGWRSLVREAHRRLAATRAALPAQLGGAAGTLASFHAHAEAAGAAPDPGLGLRLTAAYARRTGLAEPVLPWHTLRTPVADLAGSLAFTAGALGKIATDVLGLSRTETGELTEADGGASSAMPHKSNPVRAVLIAATARQLPALAAVLFGSLMAEDERPAGAWHAEWQPLREALRLTGAAARHAAELTGTLCVHPHRMRENLARTGGLIGAERLAIALTPLIGRRAARSALSRAARRIAAEGCTLEEALRAELPAVELPDLHELTDPAGYLGAAQALTDRALGERP
ncbi:3-carboxy-cis,cis-muconate cycloisomerase [Streptomyces morookaense]|uniref:3-carboxy-cis,cis-muconate cycloisomerase n=1 Tax=Streptomyces morookaense TaxID=1970 RepID=A0A7Y7B4D7_STRMO|nr:3-carboxy-cis,cis-muconate cycloisomerase [Streptomyces morookaense]NVK78818.1 3-carboxy-cis,cis-muconate cycloisomerase [Streptomyces morookaense]GHF35016.1 3-carboxy-cis,cis-muconate cycloisomerase [Streptomyces morookaense]